MCNCLDNLKENLIEDYGYKSVIVDLDNITSTYKNGEVVKNKTGQRLDITYIHKKKDGTKKLMRKKTFVAHRFCPFCGVSYEPKK